MTRERFEPIEPPSVHANPRLRARNLALSAISRELRGVMSVRDSENARTTDQQRAEWYDPLIAELETIYEWVQAGFPTPKPPGATPP